MLRKVPCPNCMSINTIVLDDKSASPQQRRYTCRVCGVLINVEAPPPTEAQQTEKDKTT